MKLYKEFSHKYFFFDFFYLFFDMTEFSAPCPGILYSLITWVKKMVGSRRRCDCSGQMRSDLGITAAICLGPATAERCCCCSTRRFGRGIESSSWLSVSTLSVSTLWCESFSVLGAHWCGEIRENEICNRLRADDERISPSFLDRPRGQRRQRSMALHNYKYVQQ